VIAVTLCSNSLKLRSSFLDRRRFARRLIGSNRNWRALMTSVTKISLLAAALALGLATAAGAAVIPAPTGNGDGVVVKVAEGCGPGFWRGPYGHCHPFAVNRACPPGYHLGRLGRRCWPN
jgi:hypothetical protein